MGSLQAAAMATATVDREGDGEQQKRWKQGGYNTLPFIMGEHSVFVDLSFIAAIFWIINVYGAELLTAA